ncbi:hypothetical protein PSCICO_37890 [Pseudomonas cichorii]|uniref:Uncharacterized protein n=1 Tax=Pseudomonas serbiensis TaxID=3064350 RepID=A0ABT9CNW4_9PSED|nr:MULTISPECIES: hypothetical protein [Pseudomonas]MDO7925535.1 hypothetical protein [Pseudomonas sp. KFB-138]GFM81196.1 hypothetical protein PSCICN_18880 [Pseudomonas cichorii]GFM88390.1 hypothetical protein PSCICO_37890 [Pseudomonas cichorii]
MTIEAQAARLSARAITHDRRDLAALNKKDTGSIFTHFNWRQATRDLTRTSIIEPRKAWV